jgi:Ca-activated chloride channel family protein
MSQSADRRRSRLPIVIAVVVGLLLVVAVRLFTGGGGDSDSGGGSTAGRSAAEAARNADCVGLAVTASSEKAALLRQIADDYVQTNPKVNGRCVGIAVTSKASGGAQEALARGWDVERDGPRPDVWTPASSSWVELLRQRLAERDAPALAPTGKLPSVAKTPLVLAMPRPMAEALGWPAKSLGWADLLALARDPSGWGRVGHPEWGRFKLGKTNPDFSTSGLNATIGTFFAATGLSSDLSVKDVTAAKTVAYVKAVESSVVHYGDTTLTFLSNLQAADDRGQGLTYISAVAVEEKSVLDYNLGNPTGDPTTLGRHPAAKTPLAAIYPKEGTLFSDNPWVVLTAPWVDDVKRAAATDFLKHVQSEQAQQRFTGAGFRTFDGKPSPKTTRENGMLSEQPKLTLSAPAPVVLDQVQRSFDAVRKRARVLLVMDVSGSMSEPVPSLGNNRLELAKTAATKAIGQFAPDDELGLWVFSTKQGEGGEPWRELETIRPVRSGLAPIKQRIAGLVPQGGTGLYATTRAAQRVMIQRFDPERINAVVLLTDGKNEYPADTDLDGLVRQLRGESPDTSVRVFSIAFGDDADLGALRRIGEASGAAAYDAKDAASIDNVFTAVISNF